MIQYCKVNNLRIVLVSSPLYKTYIEMENPKKKKRIIDFMDYLKTKYHVEYYDFSENNNFYIQDFSNDDHLNAIGAKKYSLMLNRLIK